MGTTGVIEVSQRTYVIDGKPQKFWVITQGGVLIRGAPTKEDAEKFAKELREAYAAGRGRWPERDAYKRRSRRDATSSGYDVLRYTSGKSYVEPAEGRPDYRTMREAKRAAEQANEEWNRRGRPTLAQEMGRFFAPASRDPRSGRDSKHGAGRARKTKLPRTRGRRALRAKQKWISEKIRVLRHEGYPPAQAIAIAYRMAGVPPRRDLTRKELLDEYERLPSRMRKG